VKTMFSVKVITILAMAAPTPHGIVAQTSGDQKKYAAQKVTVKGTMKGEIMSVETVLPAK
jgi:hypothetical protein